MCPLSAPALLLLVPSAWAKVLALLGNYLTWLRTYRCSKEAVLLPHVTHQIEDGSIGLYW